MFKKASTIGAFDNNCSESNRLTMVEDFSYDVFLSHSPKDKAIVREIAERLRADGLTVWFDEWNPKLSDNIAEKVEEALQTSRVLVLCMSANAFGAEWPELERQTLRFRDPLNQTQRFIPLRLDDTPIKEPLGQFPYINWQLAQRGQEYSKLLEACRSAKPKPPVHELAEKRELQLNAHINRYVFTRDAKSVLGCSDRQSEIRLWSMQTGICIRRLKGPSVGTWGVAFSADYERILSASADGNIRLWETETGHCLQTFKGHEKHVFSVAWSNDQRYAISTGADQTLRLWEIETGTCLYVFKGHTKAIPCVALSKDDHFAISGAHDRQVRLWDVQTGVCLRVMAEHKNDVMCVAWSPDQRVVFSGSSDRTIRVWDVNSGRCIRVLEGHTGQILSMALGSENLLLSAGGEGDCTVRLWEVDTGRCLRVLKGHDAGVNSVAWSADGNQVFSGDFRGRVNIWDLSELGIKEQKGVLGVAVPPVAPDQVQYTNAKVLLVGESGVGKTGLSRVLTGEKWQPTDSTVGAWATQWKLPVSSEEHVEKEIWLWDFGGQADQRLIHQLYMDETALAVLVFDGQKEDLFETLGQWDRDLTRASRKPFVKLLVAGRVDAGGLRVSRSEIEKFAAEREFKRFLETSAKRNLGCDQLKEAILTTINWDEIPCRTTEVLFKKLKEEIIRLKDEGRVLMRFNELREALQLRLTNEYKQFTNEELHAVLTLLAGPGLVWELAFGSWVLLQPERINAYGQAVIRTLQSDEHQRGCLLEERVLKGELDYESSMPRLGGDEERFVLLAMHQILVERGVCLRQPTYKGNLLVFPSYYRRERPMQVTFPAVLVSYRFTGFLDDIYATLVVRLHHSEAFDQDQLWRNAADFKTKTGKQVGVKLNRRAPGVGELEVYFDPSVVMEEKIIFSKYVHEHLLQHAREVERLRHYVCQQCGTLVGNREIAMKRLSDWLQGRVTPSDQGELFRSRKRKDESPSIICVNCEERVALWDEMEQCFASAEIQQRVRDMQEEAAIVLSNQSKERVLVGEVISTVALANQISREFNVSDHGIDMEIEFTDDNHEATGAKVYLQLKSGDSYLHKRKKDGTEVFTIKNERHARYWMAQGFPVLLVIRNSEGEVRWMEVRDWLKRESDNGNKPVKQIVFDGERFDVMSVRRWRDRSLGV